AQRVTHLARPARNAGDLRHLPVARDAAARNVPHDLADALDAPRGGVLVAPSAHDSRTPASPSRARISRRASFSTDSRSRLSRMLRTSRRGPPGPQDLPRARYSPAARPTT